MPPVQTEGGDAELDAGSGWTGEDDDVQEYTDHLRELRPELYSTMVERCEQLASPAERAEAMREMALQVASAEAAQRGATRE